MIERKVLCIIFLPNLLVGNSSFEANRVVASKGWIKERASLNRA